MLRASAQTTGRAHDLAAVTQRHGDAPADPLVEHGRTLIRFVDALVGPHPGQLDETRDALLHEAGRAALVRAAAVAGNFQMMNRLVDATGVPIGASMRAISSDLGLADDHGASH